MLLFAMTAMWAAASDPATSVAVAPKKEPTRICREMINSSSRLHSYKVCRTRAQWRRWQACHGSVTRYCTPQLAAASARLGRQTAFPLNENSRMICRMVTETGSRLGNQRICLPRREWDRMWRENAEATAVLQDKSTKVNGVDK